jgi:hypothetical protein
MMTILREADRLLRGQLLRREDLLQGRIPAGAGLLAAIGLAGGAVYGAAMGLFGLMRPLNPTWKQVAADAVKVPLLFLLTLAVALPSLYAFSALADSRLRFVDTLKLALVAVAINLVLLASFAPVTAFFTASTTSYAFMVLLNVALFVLSGAVGLGVLAKALRVIYPPRELPKPQEPEAVPGGSAPAATQEEFAWQHAVARSRAERMAQLDPRPRAILVLWFAIYGLVGAQMAWILRPFVGAPNLEFTFFRERGGNFVQAIAQALADFFSGK